MFEVIWVGDPWDGQLLGSFKYENDAIKFAMIMCNAFDDVFDPCWGGISIISSDGDVVMDW